MYEVNVMIAEQWRNLVGFATVYQCVNWMQSYDPDGTVPMQIVDISTGIALDPQAIRDHILMLRAKSKPEIMFSWKDEGF